MTIRKKSMFGIRNGAGMIGSGFQYVWNRPIILGGALLVMAVILVNSIIHESFTRYTNCHYLIVTWLRMDPFFCEGYAVKFLDSVLFAIPGLKDVLDPPLEMVRLVVAWSMVLVFAFISLSLTILIQNLKSVINLFRFKREEWSRLLVSVRIWLIFFVGFGTVFYVAVIE